MRLLFILSIILSTIVTSAQIYSGPESAEFDYTNNRWLISNTTSHQVLSRDSTGVLSVFASGFSSGPHGIEIVGDTLFCCSGNSIKGFLLSNGSPVFNINLGATFLNGITHDLSGNIITTDYSAKTIYKLNIASQTFSMIASSLVQAPNGILFDPSNNRCIFVNWGSNAPVKAIDLTTNSVTTIVSTTLGSCDGIARDGQGRYYISNWTGQSVVRFDSSFSAPPVVVVSGLHNPADIFYNILQDTLAIPNAGNSTVLFLGFGTVSVPELDVDNSLNIFPNPSTGQLNIQFTKKKSALIIKVTDMTGNLYFSRNIDPDEEGLNIDLNNLASGVYIVSIECEDHSKIIKRISLL